MGTKRSQMGTMLDVATQLKDAGAITADAGAQVGGAARVVNVGAGLITATLVVDVSAMDLAGGDEAYDLILQGSTDPTFATNVSVLTRVKAGVGIGENSFGIGRITRLFTNTGEDGEILPYLRLYIDVTAGAATASINCQAFITTNPLP